jgi:Peptidase_C39 like family
LWAVTSDSKTHYTVQNTGQASTSDRSAWGFELDVPMRSQMIYPNGGEVWCSPTSTTMILEYWSAKLGRDLADSVPIAAKSVWDGVYSGSGNWPFNTAYASSKGLSAHVDRLSSLTQAEVFIKRGVPLAISIGWKAGELPGAHITSSQGHLVVLRGFTKTGDAIINDPAAKTDANVRTVYPRVALERAWIEHSGGIVYVIEP